MSRGSGSWARRVLRGAVFFGCSAFLTAPGAVYASGVEYRDPNPDINVCGSPCDIVFGTYDPLRATHFTSSVHRDVSDGVTQVVQEAAAYLGEGYEPMLTAAISVSAFGSGQFANGTTWARMYVDFRVRPLPGETLSRNERVPVLIDYNMDYSVSGRGRASAYAHFLRSDPLILARFDGTAQMLAGELAETYSTSDNPVYDPDLGQWTYDFDPGASRSGTLSAFIAFGNSHLLELSVIAGGSAYSDPTSGESWESEAEVIMDPYIRVDPNSAYAGIAEVVYRDTAANWVPALQGYASVPEPGGALLLATGLVGLCAASRRDCRSRNARRSVPAPKR